MSQNAHLVTLTGMGETLQVLLDDEAWSHLKACADWTRGSPIPEVPSALVDRLMETSKEDTREDVIDLLTLDTSSSSPCNDIALNMPASTFGSEGESYAKFDAGPVALNDFVAKHGLTLHDAYGGYIY